MPRHIPRRGEAGKSSSSSDFGPGVEFTAGREKASNRRRRRRYGPLENLERDERVRMVRAAVDRLSDDHREIIMLKNFRGHSYQEIAELLEIPIGTVMSRLYYARRSLKEIVARLEAEGLPRGEAAEARGTNPPPGEVF